MTAPAPAGVRPVLGHHWDDLGQVDDLAGGEAGAGVVGEFATAALAALGPVVDDGVGMRRHLKPRALGAALLALATASPDYQRVDRFVIDIRRRTAAGEQP